MGYFHTKLSSKGNIYPSTHSAHKEIKEGDYLVNLKRHPPQEQKLWQFETGFTWNLWLEEISGLKEMPSIYISI